MGSPTPGRDDAVDRLPEHLRKLVVDQHHDRYTAIDHAVWRSLMRQTIAYLGKRSHPAFGDGLDRLGISSERIPRVTDVSRELSDLGWAMVAVGGYTPPARLLEFKAHRVVATTTSLPDPTAIGRSESGLFHGVVGHAALIVDETYADYLRRLGEACRKALAGGAGGSASPHIERLLRLHWWTVEHGLAGTPDSSQLYGAVLLSSIDAAEHALSPQVRKQPLTPHATDAPFELGRSPDRLFVTPGFPDLIAVLEEVLQTMEPWPEPHERVSEGAATPTTGQAKAEPDRSRTALYEQAREVRESEADVSVLPNLWQRVATDYPDDWLLPLEILELLVRSDSYGGLAAEIRNALEATADISAAAGPHIRRGLRLLGLPTARPIRIEDPNAGERRSPPLDG